jgi:hypothetical protein
MTKSGKVENQTYFSNALYTRIVGVTKVPPKVHFSTCWISSTRARHSFCSFGRSFYTLHPSGYREGFECGSLLDSSRNFNHKFSGDA